MLSLFRKNGAILQAAAASEFKTIEEFRRAVVALPLAFNMDPTPTVRFHSLRGSDIEFTYGSAPVLNGVAVDYSKWPLFGGPFLEADVDSERLVMKHGAARRVLDFRRLIIEDTAP
jgi:hypothetical protein